MTELQPWSEVLLVKGEQGLDFECDTDRAGCEFPLPPLDLSRILVPSLINTGSQITQLT